MKIIGHIHTDFDTKFGVPRQSGLAHTRGVITLEPDYARPDAVRGLEQFSHIWLLWEFSGIPEQETFRATVRPPRLGGDVRVGVFATRSPFRPNPIGLSSVRLEKIEYSGDRGPLLYVTGADLMDGTPIIDIKPYLPYVDCHPDAKGGFTEQAKEHLLKTVISDACMERIPLEAREGLEEVLALDPRPSYQEDPDRIYGMEYAGRDVRFRVEKGVLTVVDVI